jgi:hypothetical protein
MGASASAWHGIPDIVFVFNKMSDQQLSAHGLAELSATLDKFFATSDFRKNGVIRHTAAAAAASQTEDLVNFFALPLCTEEFSAGSGSGSDAKSAFSAAAPGSRAQLRRSLSDLRHRVLSMPKIAPWAKLTERDWLRSAVASWKEPRLVATLAEYKKILAGMIT